MTRPSWYAIVSAETGLRVIITPVTDIPSVLERVWVKALADQEAGLVLLEIPVKIPATIEWE